MGFAALCFIPGILAGRLMAGAVPTLSAPAAALPAFAGLALRRNPGKHLLSCAHARLRP